MFLGKLSMQKLRLRISVRNVHKYPRKGSKAIF